VRQLNLYEADDLRTDEAPVPRPGPRDIVMKVAACGICGTDLTLLRHGPGGRRPMPLGHEAAGVVQAYGAEVAGVSDGMRVVINPMSTNAVIGCGGPEGAFADYLLVREAELGRSVFAIPEGLSFAAAALAEPLAVARHGVERADPRTGEKVVLFGAGPIGLGAVIWLRRRGITDLVVVDLNEQRLARAKALGAAHVLNPARTELATALKDIFGSARNAVGEDAVDADVYMDMAGAPTIPGQVLAMGKTHARLVVTASYREPVKLDFHQLLKNEMTITSAIGYPSELAAVMADIAELSEESEIMISHRFRFEEVGKAFDVARSLDCAKVMVEFES
jgi:2-desacetyl-2-hydroxyethyl bacteriochlorophyllide A dehydrogenase